VKESPDDTEVVPPSVRIGRSWHFDRGRDALSGTPPSEPDWRISRIRLSS